MRIHALLNFYDEPIELLIASIASLKLAGVDHVVALDGAYALYPGGEPVSHPNQHAAIMLTCRELEMACTLHAPSAVWAGNEPEKRTALFALGWALADDGDWFMVHDADMVVTQAPDDFKQRLVDTDREAAKVEILDTVALRANQVNWPANFEFCGLFRAQPIIVGPNHIQYRTPDGRYLWVGNGEDEPVPTLDLTDSVLIEHRPDHRPLERTRRKLVYYTDRDQKRVERGDCSRCDVPAARLVATRWRMTRIGPVADWVEACGSCAEHFEKVGRRQLRQLGVDPDTITVENRNGRAPQGMTV